MFVPICYTDNFLSTANFSSSLVAKREKRGGGVGEGGEASFVRGGLPYKEEQGLYQG